MGTGALTYRIRIDHWASGRITPGLPRPKEASKVRRDRAKAKTSYQVGLQPSDLKTSPEEEHVKTNLLDKH